MNGHSSHTFKWINEKGEVFYVKYHFNTDAGIKNLTMKEANELAGSSPDYATKVLHDHLAKGHVASWTWYVQIMPESQGESYRFDIFDITKFGLTLTSL